MLQASAPPPPGPPSCLLGRASRNAYFGQSKCARPLMPTNELHGDEAPARAGDMIRTLYHHAASAPHSPRPHGVRCPENEDSGQQRGEDVFRAGRSHVALQLHLVGRGGLRPCTASGGVARIASIVAICNHAQLLLSSPATPPPPVRSVHPPASDHDPLILLDRNPPPSWSLAHRGLGERGRSWI